MMSVAVAGESFGLFTAASHGVCCGQTRFQDVAVCWRPWGCWKQLLFRLKTSTSGANSESSAGLCLSSSFEMVQSRPSTTCQYICGGGSSASAAHP